MEDYPQNLADLERRFSSPESCRRYLASIRWHDGFTCPRCQGAKAWSAGELWECASCGCQTSVTAGTIFHRTRTPLPMWFRTIWWVVSQKNGASALGLKRVFGFGSYQTAWAHLHKLRRAMVTPGREPLFGKVEVDESYLGGLEEGVRGRQTFKKALVVIAAEERGKRAIGRIRMRRIPDASADSLQPFVVESIRPGSTLHTDGWLGYHGLERHGFIHQITNVSTHKANASELLPRVHRVASLLKRWVLGTHQGAIDPEHLDYYLDEFSFRFNRRTSRSRGKLFYRLLQNAVRVAPAPYRTMAKNVRGPTPRNPRPQHVGGT